MAKAAKQAKAAGQAAEGNRSVVWLSGLACGALAAIAPGVAVVAAGLLIPGLVALRMDQQPGRPVARTVLTCGLAGCVQPVMSLWNMGQSFNAAIAIVTDPTAIGIAWSLAAGGWLLTELAPLLVRAVLEAAALTRSAKLRAMRVRIAEAWGLDQAPDGA
jgi:hypothetical protein